MTGKELTFIWKSFRRVRRNARRNGINEKINEKNTNTDFNASLETNLDDDPRWLKLIKETDSYIKSGDYTAHDLSQLSTQINHNADAFDSEKVWVPRTISSLMFLMTSKINGIALAE